MGIQGFHNQLRDAPWPEALPGIAVQRLMADGYGFAAEGDWKTAALVRAMKVMAKGLKVALRSWRIIHITSSREI